MRAIILAGGLGQRLGPLTARMQKCLFEIDGEAILTRAVRLILAAGVSEITVVTGHCAALVRAELERHFVLEGDQQPDAGECVSIVHNPHYASTDTAYPLWLARFAFDEPMLLVDGDVVFDEAALTALIHASNVGDVIAVAPARDGDRPTVALSSAGHLGRVSRVTRDLEPAERSLEAIGLAILSRATLTHLFPALERRVVTLDRARDPYEAAFEDLLASERLTLCALDVGNFRCIAVDRPDDLHRARMSFAADPERTPTLQ